MLGKPLKEMNYEEWWPIKGLISGIQLDLYNHIGLELYSYIRVKIDGTQGFYLERTIRSQLYLTNFPLQQQGKDEL